MLWLVWHVQDEFRNHTIYTGSSRHFLIYCKTRPPIDYMGGSALSSSLLSALTSMVAPTAVEAAEAVDDDIYQSSSLIFVVAEPIDERANGSYTPASHAAGRWR